MLRFLIGLLLIFPLFADGQAFNILYQKPIGCSNRDVFYDFIADGADGFIGAGQTNSTCSNTDNGTRGRADGWVIKIDSLGKRIWSNTCGGSMDDLIMKIISTSDHGLLAAGYSLSPQIGSSSGKGDYDFWVTKFNATGNVIWEKLFGGSKADQAWACVEANDGGYIIAGLTTSNDGDITARPGGPADVWVIKLDAGGNLIWQKTYGSSGADFASDIQKTADNEYVIVGRGGAGDGDVPAVHNRDDAWFFRINDVGNITLNKTYGGSGFDVGWSVIQTRDSGFLIGATSSSEDFDITSPYDSNDLWAVRTDKAGNLLWQKTIGGSLDEPRFSSIIEDGRGDFLFAGASTSRDFDAVGNHGWADILLTKVSANGQSIWSRMYGGSLGETAARMVYVNDSLIALGCLTNSADGDIQGSNGSADGWFVYLGLKKNVTVPAGIESQNSLQNMQVFQNENHNIVYIKSKTEIASFQLFDMLGNKLNPTIVKLRDTYTLNLDEYTSGFFVLLVEANGHRESFKVIH